MTYKIIHGNNLEILPTLPDNSVDSIVTDPPYELGFMGKKWDSSGIAYSVELWRECLRVLKPGGHLLAFSGSRTYHRMTVAIEDAGFEIRDMISWISNKTFPKSLDIGKAIDKAAGVEREITAWQKHPYKVNSGASNAEYNQLKGTTTMDSEGYRISPLTAPATPDAKKWQGWGTALKPTVEPIVMARKPIEGTVAANVLKWGTGGLNIDGSRIGTETITTTNGKGFAGSFEGGVNTNGGNTHQGRWPANIIIDELTAEIIDEQSGDIKGRVGMQKVSSFQFKAGQDFEAQKFSNANSKYDSGGASRFFYVAKASKRDRNEGLEHLPIEQVAFGGHGNNEPDGMTQQLVHAPRQNFHPTVKPTTLMSYLIKLVTPPGGTVLDPFTGSGSTGKAAILQGFDFIGIEMTAEYLPIIEGRLRHAEKIVAEAKEQEKLKEKEKLF
jgi:DNA modification methylase